MEGLEKKIVVRQDWEESERGWGERPDGCSLHLTVEDCRKYIKNYWDGMPEAVPDEYSRPCGEPYKFKVPLEIYKKVEESDNGIRIFQHKMRDIGYSKEAVWQPIKE